MAVSQNSIQALEVLNQLLARAQSGREADKDRAMRIMSLKIASDEAEANRLTNYLGSLMAQNAALEQEYVKSTGIQKKMDNMIVESDYAGTGAGSAIVGQKRSTIAMDRAGLKQQISEAETERRDIMGRLGMYYDAANRLAPELFEKYVGVGEDKTLSGISTIGDDEWAMIKENLKEGGVELTQEREAGLKKALNALGAQRFDMEQREEYLRLMRQGQQLDAVGRASAAARTGADSASKDFMASFREKINRTNVTAKSFGLKYNIDLQIPLSAQTTTLETAISAGRSALDYLDRSGAIDRSGPAFGLFKDTPDDIIDLVDDYKKATGEARNRIALQFMEKLSQNKSLITKGFDYSGLGSNAEASSGGPAFIGDLVDIYDAAMWFDGTTRVADPAGVESLNYGQQPAPGVGGTMYDATTGKDQEGKDAAPPSMPDATLNIMKKDAGSVLDKYLLLDKWQHTLNPNYWINRIRENDGQ